MSNRSTIYTPEKTMIIDELIAALTTNEKEQTYCGK